MIIIRFQFDVVGANKSVRALPDIDVDEQIKDRDADKWNEEFHERRCHQIEEILRKRRTT